MWGPDHRWQLTRHDEGLLALALARGETRIGIVYLAARPGDTGALAARLRALGGEVRVTDARIGYVRARFPIDRARAALELQRGEVAAVDVNVKSQTHGAGEFKVAAMTDHDYRRMVAEVRASVAARRKLRREWPQLHDLDGDGWRRRHPTYDGRGVTIGIVDGLIDPLIPELRTALTLDGKRVPKIAGHRFVADVDEERDPELYSESDQWVRTSVAVPAGYTLPRAGRFRFGVFDLNKPMGGSYIMSDPAESRYFGDAKYGVLWEPATGTVWVDTKRTHDFRTAKPLRTFDSSGDWSYFGALHASQRPLFVPAISFGIQLDAAHEAVGIGISIGGHASRAASSAAAWPIDDDDPAVGIAPAARIVSVSYGYVLHSEAEALISACEDPHTDLTVFEMITYVHESANTAEPESWFLSELGQRLVQTLDKPLIVGGGNTPGVAQIDDESAGPDVLSITGYQSAKSYTLYEGHTPALRDNRHYVGSSDGPAPDGLLKPDVMAPSGFVAANQHYAWWDLMCRRPGMFTLPPGYEVFAGTSQAMPTAAGAVALLISGLKQQHVHLHAVQINDALRRSARPIANLRADDQGHGLIDVAAAWKVLTAAPRPPLLARVCSGSVRTYAQPHGGRPSAGIFETIGWRAGDRGTRRLRFCGVPNVQGLRLVLVHDDGTFRAGAVTAAGSDVDADLTIAPATSGFHSVLVELRGAGNVLLGRASAAIEVPAPLDDRRRREVQLTVDVPRPGYGIAYVDVPEGTDALRITGTRRNGFMLIAWDPSGRRFADWDEKENPTLTIPSPIAGSWQIDLEDTMGLLSFHPSLQRELLPEEAPNATLVVDAIHVARGPDDHVPAGKVPVRAIGATTELVARTGTFASPDPILVPFEVPPHASATLVDLAGSDPAVDAYVLDCRDNKCERIDEIIGGEKVKRLTLNGPPAGHYVLALTSNPPGDPTVRASYTVSVRSYDRTAPGTPSAGGAGNAYEYDCRPAIFGVTNPPCSIFIAP
jgi:hypothetical protein